MHPEILSITLFGIVAAFTPGPNNFIAFYSGFNFGIKRTIPLIIGVTLGFPFLLLCVALGLINICLICRKFPYKFAHECPKSDAGY